MIRFFRKLFKRGDFMTRADKAYYKYRAKTFFWSAFCMIIIAWVGTNLVLCALTTNVTSNFDMIYEAAEPAILPIGKEVNRLIRNRSEYTDGYMSDDYRVKSITFDKFTNEEVDVYKDADENNLIAGAEKIALNVDDEIYLYRANNGADIYILSNKSIYANEDSSYMFLGLSYGPRCGNPEGVSITFNNFHTDDVKNMSYMFAGGIANMDGNSSQGFAELDLSGWNTSKVTDMSFMFSCCEDLTSLNLTGWDTKNVESMKGMFSVLNSRRIVELDLSSFDTRNVTNMNSMFSQSCWDLAAMQTDPLKTIFVSDRFIKDQVENSSNMFYHCGHLTGEKGTAWTESNPADKTYAHIDGKDGLLGYFTEKPYSGK